MICLRRFTDWSKCTTLVQDTDCGRGCVYVEVGARGNASELASQFGVNLKLLEKIKAIKRQKEGRKEGKIDQI